MQFLYDECEMKYKMVEKNSRKWRRKNENEFAKIACSKDKMETYNRILQLGLPLCQ
jgi:hypothetical protein